MKNTDGEIELGRWGNGSFESNLFRIKSFTRTVFSSGLRLHNWLQVAEELYRTASGRPGIISIQTTKAMSDQPKAFSTLFP